MSVNGTSNDSSVDFLQREHARTLQGLHAEINKLQQKCAKLTFELTMAGAGGGGRDCSSDNTSTANDDAMKQLERELTECQEVVSTQQCRLEELESHIALLKHEKNLMIGKFEEQMNSKDGMMASLYTQLEEKSNTIAQLVHKMHQMQRLLQRGAVGGVVNQDKPFLPQPPKDPPPENVYRLNKITRRVRKPITTKFPSEISNSEPNNNSMGPAVFGGTGGSLPAIQFSSTNSPTPTGTNHRLSQSYEHNSPMSISSKSNKFNSSAIQRQPSVANFLTDESQTSIHTSSNKAVLPPISDEVKLPPIPIPVPPPSDPKPATRYHRRFHLAKTQGLTSAPCSLRLSNYRRNDDNHDYKHDPLLTESPSKAEGKLLVKHETDRTILNHISHRQQHD